MGLTFQELIPVAILLDNNGLTREEFAQRMYYADKKCLNYFRHGIYDLPKLLNLQQTEQYTRFLKSGLQDTYSLNLPLKKPSLEIKTFEKILAIKFDKANNIIPVSYRWYRKPKYIVKEHLENILGQKQIIEESFSSPVEKDVTYKSSNGNIMQVIKVLETRESRVESNESSNGYLEYAEKIAARPVIEKYRTHIFNDIDDLSREYSIFNIDNMYDFSQVSGTINLGELLGKFYWKKKDDRYYLDKEKTFDNIRAIMHRFLDKKTNIHMTEPGYSDLIVTAEAVRHKKYWLISFDGIGATQGFLSKRPQSELRRERAVWDGYTSLFAKAEGMTHNELLRLRALGAIPGGFENIITYDSSQDMI